MGWLAHSRGHRGGSGQGAEMSLPEQEARFKWAKDAAREIGYSLGSFHALVRKGVIPPAFNGGRKWDMKAVHAALDRASGLLQPQLTAYDEWKASRANKAKGHQHNPPPSR